jgi:predicted ATPase/class 3 adenylate cyclase
MREDAHRLIVRSLAAAGRKAEALKHYQNLVALLKRELNAEPDATTRLLAAELRSAQPPTVSIDEPAGLALALPDKPSIAVLPFQNMSGDLHQQYFADGMEPMVTAPTGQSVPSAQSTQMAPSAKKAATAERRQLTVASCELLFGARRGMDPEDLREIVPSYHSCVADTAGRYDAFVAHTHGNTASLFFGYPHAREDDAERAVHAALSLITAVASLKSPIPLHARIGMATGLVVVDPASLGEPPDIAGETPTIASRLHGIAAADEVVIAEGTRRLLGALFELQDLGLQNLEGIAESGHGFKVVRPSSPGSRFEALRTSDLTALVGREEELQLLLRRWSRAKAGLGQVVLLSGEAGIGKSRLAAELLETIANEPHTRLRYSCSPQHIDSAFYPIINQLKRAAGLAGDAAPQAKVDRLDALLATVSTSKQDAALLAELLSLPNDGRYPTVDLAPQERRQRTLDALTAQMEALSRQKPLLMIFEDAHWSDPTSLEAFGRAVGRLKALPILLLVTFRPEFHAPWVGWPYVTSLTINRLTEREITAMIDRVVGNKQLSAHIRQDIVERSDGIPLFVEEMTKAVLEAESEEAAARVAAAVPSRGLTVPASLHASLMARLDRLGPAKELAQIGAAIGREFAHALLAAVVQHKSEGELASALDRLIAAGLLFRQNLPPHANYLFKHALVQDAAYSTLLRAPRQKLHARIATVLEQQFPERTSSEPELLARHFGEAGQVEVAISYWLKAGHRAAERSADEEAVHHLRRGLEMLMTLPESTQRDRQELDFQLALRTPLTACHGYGSLPVGTASDRAIALCEKLDDTQRLLPSLYGQYIYCLTSGRIAKGFEYAQRCQSLAARTGDRLTRLLAHRALGTALLEMGEFEAARAQLDQFLALDDAKKDRSLLVHYFADPHATGLAFLTLSLWALGYPDQAAAVGEKAVEHAAEANHANTSGHVNIYAGILFSALVGNMEAVARYVEYVNARPEGRMPSWNLVCQIMQGWAFGCSGRLEDGITLIKKGIDTSDKVAGIYRPHYYSLFAILQARAGNTEDALSAISKAKQLIADSGEYFWHADVLRIEGELGLLFGASTKEAEANFARAIEVAREQQAKSFELRASTSIARLWRDQGKQNEARELLVPIFGWFTEGFDTRDLREAKALLEVLAS